jgi:alpha-beta hydrolase superfamily lysophospholipase
MVGTFAELAEALHQAGYAVLRLDLRGHGESGGEKRYTFGVTKRGDVLGAVDWLLGQELAPGSITVLGTSMGGTSATGATAAELAIGALILDGALPDLKPLIQQNSVGESGLPL